LSSQLASLYFPKLDAADLARFRLAQRRHREPSIQQFANRPNVIRDPKSDKPAWFDGLYGRGTNCNAPRTG
jgi:hypothetical protein